MIYTREMLGWPTAREMQLNPARTDAGMVMHWDGGNRKLADKAHTECVRYWKWCREFHINTRNWRDIGYSYGVCPHGDEFAGRTYGYEQAAQPGGNTTWVSCSLMLGPGEAPTVPQIAGVHRLRDRLMGKGLHAHIRGHSNFISTDCPGPMIRALITNGTFSTPATSDNSWTDAMLKELPTLKLGDVSYDVKSVRALLFARGAVARTDLALFLESTEFDSELTGIVKLFQTAKKLTSDGIVGPKTWLKLIRVEVK